jgi:hypothetical protein
VIYKIRKLMIRLAEEVSREKLRRRETIGEAEQQQ